MLHFFECELLPLGGEETYLEESGTSEDNEFDMVVGALEEIMLGDEFVSVQKGFCDAHCGTIDIMFQNVVGLFVFVHANLTTHHTSLLFLQKSLVMQKRTKWNTRTCSRNTPS